MTEILGPHIDRPKLPRRLALKLRNIYNPAPTARDILVNGQRFVEWTRPTRLDLPGDAYKNDPVLLVEKLEKLRFSIKHEV